MTPALLVAIVAAVFTLAGFVKGAVGLGLPTVAMGLLGLLMAPGEAAALLVIPALVTNIWQLWAGPSLRPLAWRLWPMQLALCVGAWMGAGWLTAGSSGQATIGLGVALIVYAILGLSPLRPKVPPRWKPALGPLVGFSTGLVTAATGVFVVPAVPYLHALDLEKEDLVQALGLSFTVSSIALAGDLVGGGVLRSVSVVGASLLCLVPAMIGVWIGQDLRKRIRPEPFRRWFFLGLLCLGADLAARGLF